MQKLIRAVSAAAVAALVCLPAFAADPPKDDKPRDLDAAFKRLDADADGKLTFDEFKGKREEEKARKAFDRKDADKDGSLTLEEFKTMPKKKNTQAK